MQFNSSAEPVHSSSDPPNQSSPVKLMATAQQQLVKEDEQLPPPLPKTPPPKKTPFLTDSLSLSFDDIDSGKTNQIVLSLPPISTSFVSVQQPLQSLSDDDSLIKSDSRPQIPTEINKNIEEEKVGKKEDRKERSKSLISLDEWRALGELAAVPTEESPEDDWRFKQPENSETKTPEEKIGEKCEENKNMKDIKEARMQTIDRTKSLPRIRTVDPERRRTAMEVLATPPMFKPKEEEDLIKLRNQIVRASRSRKALPKTQSLK